MKEQQFQRSGLTDSDTIADLGKQLNADYVLAGHITVLGGDRKLLLITIIDVEELQQIAGDYREYQRIENVIDMMPDMAKRIADAVGRSTSNLPRLAVLPFNVLSSGMDQGDAELLAQLLATELVNSGAYAVFPRTRAIEKVMEEHHIERSGMTEVESIKVIGEAVNVQYVLSANVRRLGEDNYFSASVLHIVEASQGQGTREKYRDVTDGLTLMPRIARTLAGIVEAPVPAGADRAATGTEAARARSLQNSRISTGNDFTQAVAGINALSIPGTYRITLTNSIALGSVTFTSGDVEKTIIIRGDATLRIITNTGSGNLFTVGSGNTLVLERNVKLDGNNREYNAVRVNEGGALVMKAGSHVEGAKQSGVYVGSGGRFTMEGGEISGNTGANAGGGVYVTNGTFTMSGGTLSENAAAWGGGVLVIGGRFTMEGGEINGNIVTSGGGGVYADDGSTFTMSRGTISGNTAATSGGGVFVDNAVFMMPGGTISGNTAANAGGGVYVNSTGRFTKSGGTISGSNTANYGDVVYDDGGRSRWRDKAAGPGVNMDSTVSGVAGGWPVPKQPIEPVPIEPVLGVFGSLYTNGGSDSGLEIVTADLQIGIYTEALGGLYVLADTGAGLGYSAGGDGSFRYHVGAMLEKRFLEVFFLGAGGGLAGWVNYDGNTSQFPFVRGSFAIAWNGSFQTKVYYDYNFDHGYRLGFLVGALSDF
jgi:TolB-like protein